MNYRPIDIARKLNISTSLLRHYEKWQLFPIPERSPSGYRIYTEESLYYLQAVRTMTITYGYKKTKEIIQCVQAFDFIQAMWLINEEQSRISQKRNISQQTLTLLHGEDWQMEPNLKKRGWMTIGEAAKFLAVPETTIRHWCNEKLVAVTRDKDSHYRKFDEAAIQRLLLIRMIRTSTWSLDEVRMILDNFDTNSPQQMIQLAEQSLQALNTLLTRQLIANKFLYQLIHYLAPDFFQDFPSGEFY